MSNSKFMIEVDDKEMPEILAICDQLGCTPTEYFMRLHRHHNLSETTTLKNVIDREEMEHSKKQKTKK